MRLEYDHHFESTSSARSHADHFNLCIGVVQITTGDSSQVLCSCSVWGGHPMNKRIRKDGLDRAWWFNMLRSVAEGLHLRRNALDIYLGNTDWYPLECWVVPVPGCLGRVLHRGIHIQGSVARVSLIKERLGSR
jgi:hypothetical protein